MPARVTIFTMLEYDQMIRAAAVIWNDWWKEKKARNVAYARSPDKKERAKVNHSDFMMAVEVPAASKAVADYIAKYGLKSYEMSGLWHTVGQQSTAHVDGAPTLEVALEKAEQHAVMGSVLTVGGSSMCVALVNGEWFVFDSHGVDTPGRSSLFSFKDRFDVMKFVRNTFEAVDEIDDQRDLYAALEANSYTLHVMHF
jgi:hypothetical protein